MLPLDCEKWLTSKGKINRAGAALTQDPSDYTALRQVQCFRLFRALGFSELMNSIVPAIDGRAVRVAGRLKRLPSIIRKIDREDSGQLARIADILGLRVVCTSYSEAADIVANLQGLDHCIRTINYCESPRDTGYRCWHLIFRQEQAWPVERAAVVFDVEVQIRTYWQHLWAQKSESYGEQVKEGRGPQEARSYLATLSDKIAEKERDDPDAMQIEFDAVDVVQNVVVVRRVMGGTDRPIIQPFKQDYSGATRQLLQWEEDLAAGQSETLFLVGVGDIRGLGITHSVFLGAEEIPLPAWADKIHKLEKTG